MSVEPIEKSRCLNVSSTSLVISKESGVTLVHPDGKELPESFEYMKPEKSDAGMYFTYKNIAYFCALRPLFVVFK